MVRWKAFVAEEQQGMAGMAARHMHPRAYDEKHNVLSVLVHEVHRMYGDPVYLGKLTKALQPHFGENLLVMVTIIRAMPVQPGLIRALVQEARENLDRSQNATFADFCIAVGDLLDGLAYEVYKGDSKVSDKTTEGIIKVMGMHAVLFPRVAPEAASKFKERMQRRMSELLDGIDIRESK